MKKYLLHFEASSSTHSLAELRKLLGHRGSPGSRDRSQALVHRDSAAPKSVWRRHIAGGTNLQRVIAKLESSIRPFKTPLRRLGSFDVAPALVLGVFFDTANVSIGLSPAELKSLHAVGIPIEVVGYPCTFSPQTRNSRRAARP